MEFDSQGRFHCRSHCGGIEKACSGIHHMCSGIPCTALYRSGQLGIASHSQIGAQTHPHGQHQTTARSNDCSLQEDDTRMDLMLWYGMCLIHMTGNLQAIKYLHESLYEIKV